MFPGAGVLKLRFHRSDVALSPSLPTLGICSMEVPTLDTGMELTRRDASFQLLPATTMMHPYLKQGTLHLSFLQFEMSSARCPFINWEKGVGPYCTGALQTGSVVWGAEPT